MKTGLVTFYHIHHYGAALQAAATERAVETLGHECEIIDYFVNQDNALFRRPTGLGSAAAHYGAALQAAATERAVETLGHECEIIDYFVNQDNALFRRPTGLGSAAADAHTALHYQALKTRYERFEQFSRDHLRISAHRYPSAAELRQAQLPYDAILSGSDQIWNPKIFPNGHFDPVFFGAFSDRRKIAYAPSFGIPKVPEDMEQELRSYLDAFSHLSVRERQGQAIVTEVTGQTVPVVLDPTLLLTAEQWSELRSYLDAFSHLSVRERQGQAIVTEVTGQTVPVVLDPTLLLTAEQWSTAASRHMVAQGGRQALTPQGYILCYCINRPGALAPYIQEFARPQPPATWSPRAAGRP